MVLNQLTTSPQSDSFMADEADEVEGSGEGSGGGSGSSRTGWDDSDNEDEYASGEGSGENPITTQAPGVTDSNGNIFKGIKNGCRLVSPDILLSVISVTLLKKVIINKCPSLYTLIL